MTAKRGSTVLVKRGDGASPTEAFTTVGSLTQKSINFDGGSIDITTDADVDANGEVWANRFSGVKSIAIDGEMILKAIEPAQSIYEDYALGSKVNYQIIIPYIGTWVVPMRQAAIPFTANHDGVITMGVNMESAGAPTFTAESA